LVGSALCGGKAYALLEDFLRSCLRLAGVQRDSLYDEMNLTAAKGIPDGNPLLVSTRFAGTRDDPAARGAISNIGMDNFDAVHLVNGTLTGIARELHELYLQMKSGTGAQAKQVIGSGNAIRKNRALVRAVQEMFSLPVLLPVHQEEASFGAALAALIACGHLPDIGSAKDWIKYIHETGN
jgi:sedoheptulokinase